MTIRSQSKQIALGVIDAIFTVLMWFIVALLICNIFGIDIDPTDQDSWHRSGLKYYKDYGTGAEYISGADGKLILREHK